MEPDLNYAWEKTYVAVGILCTGRGPLSDRLIRAWQDSLRRLMLPKIPDPALQERFADIADYFAFPPGGGPLPIEGLPWEEQARIANEILELHFAIRDRQR